MRILLTTLNSKYVHTNIALKYLYETIRKVTKAIMSFNNITTHLDLIAGLPYENYERFKKSLH